MLLGPSHTAIRSRSCPDRAKQRVRAHRFRIEPRGALPVATLLALSLVGAPTSVARTAAPAKCMNGQRDPKGHSSVDGAEIAWEDASRFDDARRHSFDMPSNGAPTVRDRKNYHALWS
ncbi:hypothetical protein [Streptomyces sp. NPDC058268]|uniref:hypothetical protein n=1 Tax=Streptomyces sp. NPDC058268 TaxID=3346413 RepID=UPI0036EF6CE8